MNAAVSSAVRQPAEPDTRRLVQDRHWDYIGADPEIFVEDGTGNLIPAFEFLGPQDIATDYAPAYGQVPDNVLATYGGREVKAYWDGYQAEYSMAPFECLDALTTSLWVGMELILAAARRVNAEARLSARTVVDIDEARLSTDNPEHVQFGCSPSFNAYKERIRKVPGHLVPFRSAGGHLHFTYPSKLVVPAVMELDRTLGVVATSMFRRYEEARRRNIYGRAGEYRQPKYGFEYRVLSNAWLFHPGTAQYVYEFARRILWAVNKYGGLGDSWDVTADEARACINECDTDLAEKLLRRNEHALKMIHSQMPYGGEVGWVDAWVNEVIYKGVHTVRGNPNEVSRCWGLDRPFGMRYSTLLSTIGSGQMVD